jgi:hypothetical protein
MFNANQNSNLVSIWRGTDILEERVYKGKTITELLNKTLGNTSNEGFLEIYEFCREKNQLNLCKEIRIINELELCYEF